MGRAFILCASVGASGLHDRSAPSSLDGGGARASADALLPHLPHRNHQLTTAARPIGRMVIGLTPSVSACMFCDRTPTTNAHIFRKAWLEQIFPGLEQFEHRDQRRGEGGFDRSWSKNEADIKDGCACESCNGGWMDQLDHAAEDIFATAAASGHLAKIASVADQLTVARWCALIAVLADQTQVKPVVEPAAHKALAASGIPDGTHIWLMKTEPPEWRAHGWLEPREFELRSSTTASANAYFLTFGVHHLVVQVFVPTAARRRSRSNARGTRLSFVSSGRRC